MSTAAFTVWLLLFYSASNGHISLQGQYWTERACRDEVAERAKSNQRMPSLYHCHKLVVPEPKP